MSNKKSPFDRKMSAIDIAEAAGRYFELSGRHILQDLSKKRSTGKVVLLIDGMTPQQQLTAPMWNWEAVKCIKDLCKTWEKVDFDVVNHLDPRFKVGAAAVKATNFKMPVPHLSRETYQALIEELNDDLLVNLLQLFKDEVDYMKATHNFVPDQMLRSELDAAHRYIKVHQRHGGWDAKPKRNLKVVLKRYRQWVMQAVNKEYKDGNRVFPEKYAVHLV